MSHRKPGPDDAPTQGLRHAVEVLEEHLHAAYPDWPDARARAERWARLWTWNQLRRGARPANAREGRDEMGASRRAADHEEVAPCILLAEDDPDLREMLAAVLRRDGYEVVEAADGDTALDHLAAFLVGNPAQRAELIVTDIRMPGCTGMQLLEGLRAADWPIPFVLITAFGDPELHEHAERLGAARVVDKPFTLRRFLDAVHDATDAPPPSR